MPEIELSAGTIEYEDTGGGGPTLVLVHGLLMSGTVWRKLVPELRGDYRCVVPTLPLGSHRKPMKPDADLSPWAQARLLGEFIERLDLTDVTLVQNDIGLGQMLAGDRPDRLGRLVLVATEAFENYPPGVPGRGIAFAARHPALMRAAIGSMRFRLFHRFFAATMAKQRIPAEITAGWFRPLLTLPEIRRDFQSFCDGIESDAMLVAADRLKDSTARP